MLCWLLAGRQAAPSSRCGWGSVTLGTAMLYGQFDPLRVGRVRPNCELSGGRFEYEMRSRVLGWTFG